MPQKKPQTDRGYPVRETTKQTYDIQSEKAETDRGYPVRETTKQTSDIQSRILLALCDRYHPSMDILRCSAQLAWAVQSAWVG